MKLCEKPRPMISSATYRDPKVAKPKSTRQQSAIPFLKPIQRMPKS